MTHVLTLVADPATAGLDPAVIARVATAVDAEASDLLAPAEAVDLPCAAPPDMERVAAAIGEAPFDAIGQPASGRRKALLVSDMDSTIVTTETLDELAAYAGLKERVAAITRASMDGELDFSQALRARVAMLAGLREAALEATWAATAIMPGAADLVATMRAHGARAVLVSGGFTWFTDRVAAALGFDAHQANVLVLDGGCLTGAVGEPILDRDAKLAVLVRESAALGLHADATLAVGDGANDLAMIGAAGLGVAFHPRPIVAAAARAVVRHCGLRALLFAQGYRATEIVNR